MALEATLENIIKVGIVVPLGDPHSPLCHWGIPLLIWGEIGIGKSERIKAIGEELKMYTGIILPAGRLPEDFAGVAVQDGKGGLQLACMMKPINELVGIGEGLLYIDEINTARMAVQTTITGVILDKRAGDVYIPPKVRMIAAANPVGAGMDGHPLDPRLANRFLHIDHYAPTVEEWISWRMGKPKKKDLSFSVFDAEEKVKKEWNATWPEVFGAYCGYFKAIRGEKIKNNKLHDIPVVGSPERNRAFPTPRSWDWASRVSVTCKILGAGHSIESRMLKGCVGDGAASEFMTYRLEANFPTPRDVLDGKFTPNRIRLDLSTAAYNSMAAYVVAQPEKARLKDGVKAWKALAAGCEAGIGDIAYGPAEMLLNNRLGSLAGPEFSKIVPAVMNHFDAKFINHAKNAYGQEL